MHVFVRNIEVMHLAEHLCNFLTQIKVRFIVLSPLIIFAYLYVLLLNCKHLPELKGLCIPSVASTGRTGTGRAGIGRAGIGRAGIGRADISRAGIGRAGICRARIGRYRHGRHVQGGHRQREHRQRWHRHRRHRQGN